MREELQGLPWLPTTSLKFCFGHELGHQYSPLFPSLEITGARSSISVWLELFRSLFGWPSSSWSLEVIIFKLQSLRLLTEISFWPVSDQGYPWNWTGDYLQRWRNNRWTDIVARIFNKYTTLSMGRLMLIVDAIVLTTVLIVFKDFRIATYTLLFIWLTPSSLISSVKEVLQEKDSSWFTSKPDEIAKQITTDLGRGVTFVNGMGYYSQQEMKIVYCVVSLGMKWNKWKISSIRSIHLPSLPLQKPTKSREGFTLDTNKQPIAR